LVLSAGNYNLNPTTGGTGPVLKNGGAPVIAGNYGAWSPVAAEQVSGGGYDVAWKNASTGYFSIWSTDSNGNFVSTLTPEVPGTDSRLKAFEPVFHQDLNGDGAVGAAPVAIVDGSFVFNQNAGGSTLSAPLEPPDPMPAPADAQTASEQWTQPAGHDSVVADILMDVLHHLHGSGFLLS
jgi:serralysin